VIPHVPEHGEEVIRPQVAWGPRHFPFGWRQRFERSGFFREKLERRRETHTVFDGQFFFGHLGAVKIGHLARSDNVELQYFEIRLYVLCDSQLRKIDEVRLLAIGAASELPHDRKALTLLAGSLEIIGKVEEAL